MKTLILCLCLLAVPAVAQTVDPDKAVVGRNHPSSTASFVAACEQNEVWCNGYLGGAAAVQTQPFTCTIPGMKPTDFRPMFLAWYRKNPQAADMRGSLSIIRFNTESFPCGATRS